MNSISTTTNNTTTTTTTTTTSPLYIRVRMDYTLSPMRTSTTTSPRATTSLSSTPRGVVIARPWPPLGGHWLTPYRLTKNYLSQ